MIDILLLVMKLTQFPLYRAWENVQILIVDVQQVPTNTCECEHQNNWMNSSQAVYKYYFIPIELNIKHNILFLFLYW